MISIGRFSCGEFIGINRPASGFSGLQWDGIVGLGRKSCDDGE